MHAGVTTGLEAAWLPGLLDLYLSANLAKTGQPCDGRVGEHFVLVAFAKLGLLLQKISCHETSPLRPLWWGNVSDLRYHIEACFRCANLERMMCSYRPVSLVAEEDAVGDVPRGRLTQQLILGMILVTARYSGSACAISLPLCAFRIARDMLGSATTQYCRSLTPSGAHHPRPRQRKALSVATALGIPGLKHNLQAGSLPCCRASLPLLTPHSVCDVSEYLLFPRV